MKFSSLKIRFISFNAMSAFNFDTIHGFISSLRPIKRQKMITDILLKENADVIALQEIHTYFVLNLYKKKLNYPYVVYKKYLYGPRGGLVIFSKFPVGKFDYLNFSKRGSLFNSSFIARVIKNGALVCTLQDVPITILDVHATPNLDHDDSENNRFIKFIEAQLMQIADLVNELKSSSRKVLIGGDFNVAKNSVPYKKFLRKSGLLDIFSKDDFPTQHQEYLSKNKKVKRIDYVFMQEAGTKSKIISSDYLFREKYEISKGKKNYLSDHIGLKTTVDFKF